jgi:hypothetical protein
MNKKQNIIKKVKLCFYRMKENLWKIKASFRNEKEDEKLSID